MRTFEYVTAEDVAGAIGAVTDGAAFLAGGTNLVDLIKLGVATPGVLTSTGSGWVRWPSCRAAACASVPECLTATWPRTIASAGTIRR